MAKVIKRDERCVEFDKEKIIEAIEKAFNDVDGEITPDAEKKATEIATFIENSIEEEITVEEIQDMIEEKLMASKRKDVAKAFILYRDKRTRARENKMKLMKDISEKLAATNVQNQNANIDEKSFGGRIGEASDAVLKEYALNNCMSEMSRNNHLNNEIYIHDLNSYAVGEHNCLTIPFDKLLAEGFKIKQTDIRPPQSVGTAFQLVAVIFQIQSLQQFGGVSASHLDWTMVPYVRKSFYKHYADGAKYVGHKSDIWIQQNVYDMAKNPKHQSIASKVWTDNKEIYQYALDMTEKEVYQAVEGFYHNSNSLQSRSGNQLEEMWLTVQKCAA